MERYERLGYGDGSEARFAPTGRYTAGFPIGIIAIQLDYAKMPGNVVNATTFPFPVVYRKLNFEIERLFAGDPELGGLVIDAARELEAEGVRAIVGACGFFAHFQEPTADAVSVPVYLSSLCQIPLILQGLRRDQKIAIFTADDSIDELILSHVGATDERLIITSVGGLASFAPIRYGKEPLDNKRLSQDLAERARQLRGDHPEIGAVLLECSDLPPYAADIQAACALPVFDFITLIKWVELAVVQHHYVGYM